MARVQQGLEVAFYLYPCGLFAALLTSQSLDYFRARRASTLGSSKTTTSDDPEKAEGIRRFYARLLWLLQLMLSILLVRL